MFGIGFYELCIIGIAALILVGPKKLPELMRQIGKLFLQARKLSFEIKDGIESAINIAELEEAVKDLKKPPLGAKSFGLVDKLESLEKIDLGKIEDSQDSSAVKKSSEGNTLQKL